MARQCGKMLALGLLSGTRHQFQIVAGVGLEGSDPPFWPDELREKRGKLALECSYVKNRRPRGDYHLK
jgi:hypothetical protein